MTFGREADCRDIYLVPCGYFDPIPSPDGRFLLYRGVGAFPDDTSLWVSRANGSGRRLLASDGVAGVAWSPNSNKVAYVRFGTDTGLQIVRRDGSGRRVIGPAALGVLVWSKNGGTVSVQRDTGRVRSPNGRFAASVAKGGIHLTDIRTGRSRVLTRDQGFDLTWSPDSKQLAYIKGHISSSWAVVDSGDVRSVNLNGRVRTLVPAGRAYGGRIVSLAWTRGYASARYPRPTPAAARIAPTDFLADGPVERLAVDGDHVAYASCLRVAVWSPATRTVSVVHTHAEAVGIAPSACVWGERSYFYSLAIAGNRVAYGERSSGLCYGWSIQISTFGSTSKDVPMSNGTACVGGPFLSGVMGTLVGADTTLVASSWHEAPSHATTDQTVVRLDLSPCACATLASTPGPLVPFDVQGNRIVASGTNETWILDPQGTLLRSIPVSPLAAQIDGSQLVLLFPGVLRIYDLNSGATLHSWPLPAATSGAEYGDPANRSHLPLVLEDAAHGFAAYVVDHEVHVVNIANGTDRALGSGQLARFGSVGLVYADGARIHIVPYSAL